MTRPGASREQIRAAAEKRRRDREAELALTRGRATNWAKGIGAVLVVGLAFSLVKGRTDLNDLDQGFAIAVGGLLLVAVVTACVAAVFLFRAAYGRLETVSGAVTDHKLAVQTIHDLRTGLWWALAGTALLLGAVGVTWYGPSADGPRLEVVDAGGTSWCGEPVRTGAGILTLKVRGQEVQIDLMKANQVMPVESCTAP